jgi:peptidylprolyl isomerase
MKKSFFICLLALTVLSSCKDKSNNLPDGLYADIETNKGNIIVLLDFEKAPITVANFVTLAEGKNNFVAPQFKGKPFYDGLKFHRVIPEFMIQGGDPLGDGTGDAGYVFRDEITDMQFDNGGVLAMANSGPGTNSSQFFITHVATPWLEGKHSIFGHVIEKGMEIVNKIEPNDHIVKVTIIRNGITAKRFDAIKVFANFFTLEAENLKKQAIIDAENKKIYDAKYKAVKAQKVAYFESNKKTATKTNSGLLYKVITKGKGKKPAMGSTVYIHYAGFLENGELFDSSLESVSRTFGKFDQRKCDARQYTPIPFEAGNKQGMIPGFIEGLEKLSFGDKAILFIPSPLAYGAQGAGGVIPPNANIIFEIELLESMPK